MLVVVYVFFKMVLVDVFGLVWIVGNFDGRKLVIFIDFDLFVGWIIFKFY